MARSLKKGPFVDTHLLKKVAAIANDSNKASKVIKTWSRRSTVVPEFIGITFAVHTERNSFRLRTDNMIGHN